MDENTTMTPAEPTAAPETVPVSDPDNWDDIDFSDIRDDAAPPPEEPEEHAQEPEADQPSGEEAQEEEPKEEPEGDKPEEAQQEEADPLFELKHFGEVRTVNRDEVVTLAQKGMDYDKVRTERDTARSRHAELEQFLQELAAPNGWSIEELMDQTRANVLADKEGIDQGVALQRVKLDRDRRAFEAQQQQAQAAQQAQSQEGQRVQQSFQRFIREYPDVDPKEIPKEVWDAFGTGQDLAGSYARWENKQLRQRMQELEAKQTALEQNEKNKERSTGSQQTASVEGAKKRDPIDEDWYSGD